MAWGSHLLTNYSVADWVGLSGKCKLQPWLKVSNMERAVEQLVVGIASTPSLRLKSPESGGHLFFSRLRNPNAL